MFRWEKHEDAPVAAVASLVGQERLANRSELGSARTKSSEGSIASNKDTYRTVGTNMRSFFKNKDEWVYFRNEKQFKKRCLFDVNGGGGDDDDATGRSHKVHLRTKDSLTYRYLLDSDLNLPHEDQVYQAIGAKRRVDDDERRNHLTERAPCDNSYKLSEYSKDFYLSKSRNWRSEKYEPAKNHKEFLSNDFVAMFKLNFLKSSVYEARTNYESKDDARLARVQDINDVRRLDNWKRSPPLEMPFKVLDLTDKHVRYRPKVTR